MDTTTDRRTVAIRAGQSIDAIYEGPWGLQASPEDACRAGLEAISYPLPVDDDWNRLVDAYNAVMCYGGFDSTGEACAHVLLGLVDSMFGFQLHTIPEEATA